MCVLPRGMGASERPGQRQGFATVCINGQIVGGKACERFVDSCIRQSRQAFMARYLLVVQICMHEKRVYVCEACDV